MRVERVLVVGCGGLGGFVIEGLERLRVPELVLMDGDVFCESNMNRQLESGLDTLGKFKAEVYKERIWRKHGKNAVVVCEFLTEKNADIIRSVDLVVDCVDNIKTRLFLEKVCDGYQKTLIHGGLEGCCGQVCACFPGEKKLSKLYAGKDEVRHSTNVYTVSVIAALEVALVDKIMNDREDEIKGKLFLANMDSFAVDELHI